MRQWFERISATLARKPGRHPTAFCSLRAVSEGDIAAYDGIRHITVPWTSVRRITAQMGRQQYDMTPTLMIDHSAGRSIFLAEGEALWAPFIAAMLVHLQGALPPDEWTPHLSADPKAVIRLYRR